MFVIGCERYGVVFVVGNVGGGKIEALGSLCWSTENINCCV